jgi:cytochrome c553
MTSLKSAIVLIALCFANQAYAVGVKGDAAAGKKKATACAACHGLDGNKTLDNTYPKLAGQYPDYLLKADLVNLAVYYGSQKAEIGVLK